MEATGDIAQYKEHLQGLSNSDLLGILEHIDRRKVPDRYEAVVQECKRRNLIDDDATDADVEHWQLDQPVRQMNPSRYVRRGIILLAILALGGPVKIGWQRFVDHRDRKALETQVHDLFTQMPSYEQEAAFIDQAFASSFAAQYETIAALTKPPTERDVDVFLGNICDAMILAARNSGKDHLADELGLFKIVHATNAVDDEPFEHAVDPQ